VQPGLGTGLEGLPLVFLFILKVPRELYCAFFKCPKQLSTTQEGRNPVTACIKLSGGKVRGGGGEEGIMASGDILLETMDEDTWQDWASRKDSG
jgi:hypothetical protein